MAEQQGVVGNLISGTGGLIIGVIIVLVIVSTLLAADLLRSNATTITAQDDESWLNGTTYTLSTVDGLNSGFAIVTILNNTDSVPITSVNYSLDANTGVLTNITDFTSGSVNITFTYSGRTSEEQAANNMETNFTRGIDNVSGKIPTILLMGAVVLLFGIMVLLVRQSQAMGLGGGGGRGSL